MKKLRSLACLGLTALGATFHGVAFAQPAPAAPAPAAPAPAPSPLALPPEVPPPPNAGAPPNAEPAPASAPPAPATAAAPGAPLAPTPLGKPKMNIAVQEPAPSVPRTYHMHDGFYARMSVGFGWLGATFDDADPSGKDLQGSGVSLSFDAMIGHSVTPGVIVGVDFIGEASASVQFERGALEQDRSVSLFIVGPFLDAYPEANGGWHLGGTVGFAHVSTEDNLDGSVPTNGVGGAFWLGHDFWTAENWSFGPLLRLSGSYGEGDKFGFGHNSSSFAVTALVTGVYN